VLFGNAGAMFIDLPSESAARPLVHDMYVGADGSVVAAGGDANFAQAFVVRLLGANGGDSPGVLSMADQTLVSTQEGNDEVVVNVRRTGGSSGAVSVAFQTLESGSPSAVNGLDYNRVAGDLSWADGDATERQIRIEILADDAVEAYESFQLELSDPQGGAGMGTRRATVEIAADGSPYGQLGFPTLTGRASEGGLANVDVIRDYYSTGTVTVTLTPVAGTATAGSDFASSPVTLSWADGESGSKTATFAIVDDTLQEDSESFTIELSNATGGALIKPQGSMKIWILPSDAQTKYNTSGGGMIGYLSLFLLGVTALIRSTRKAIRAWSPLSPF